MCIGLPARLPSNLNSSKSGFAISHFGNMFCRCHLESFTEPNDMETSLSKLAIGVYYYPTIKKKVACSYRR